MKLRRRREEPKASMQAQEALADSQRALDRATQQAMVGIGILQALRAQRTQNEFTAMMARALGEG